MRVSAFLWCTGVLLVMTTATARAQDEAEQAEPQTHILTITSFSVPPGDDATGFWDYVDRYIVPADRENPHILSERMGSHYWGDNEQNVWFISEYEDLAALQAAEDWTSEYNEKRAPEGSAAADSADKAFEEQFLPYFRGHKDNIVTINMKRVK